MNALPFLFVALVALALWHFVYEGIFLPSARFRLRFKLFALRDRLRNLKADNPRQCGPAAFDILDESLNWQIEHQYQLTISLLRGANRRYYSDSSFAKQVNDRVARLNECQLPEYIEIRRLAGGLFQEAAFLNSGSWLIFAIPVAVGLAFATKMAEVSGRLVGAPKGELNRMAHCGT